jgi:hypothetical protein
MTARGVETTPDPTLELFKFYEDAAEKTKTAAWSQTTWMLTLNAGIMAFSLDFYANHSADPHFVLVEGVSTGVGIGLCVFLIYLLQELGGHISHYWTSSNTLAVADPRLTALIFPDDVAAAKANRPAPFPAFCRRLQALAGLFAAAHIGWLAIAARVLA